MRKVEKSGIKPVHKKKKTTQFTVYGKQETKHPGYVITTQPQNGNSVSFSEVNIEGLISRRNRVINERESLPPDSSEFIKCLHDRAISFLEIAIQNYGVTALLNGCPIPRVLWEHQPQKEITIKTNTPKKTRPFANLKIDEWYGVEIIWASPLQWEARYGNRVSKANSQELGIMRGNKPTNSCTLLCLFAVYGKHGVPFTEIARKLELKSGDPAKLRDNVSNNVRNLGNKLADWFDMDDGGGLFKYKKSTQSYHSRVIKFRSLINTLDNNALSPSTWVEGSENVLDAGTYKAWNKVGYDDDIE